MDVEILEVSMRQQSGRRDFGIGAGDRVGLAIVLAFAVAVVSLFSMRGTRLATAAPLVHRSTQSARAPPHQASTYDCAGPLNLTRCYGVAVWEFPCCAQAYGTSVDQQVPNLGCFESGCNDFGYHISDEMWMIDGSTWAANQCNGVACWIEEGVTTQGDNDYYFWEDERPCVTSGSKWAYHPQGMSYLDIGYFISSTINNHSSDAYPHDCSHKADWQWTESIWNGHTNSWQFLNDLSKDNPIHPDRVWIGLELDGKSNGEYASQNQFQNVQYIQNGVWNLVNQSGPDYPLQNPPVTSWWTPGNPLGYWDTSCGC